MFLVTRGLGVPDNLHVFILCTCIYYNHAVLREDVVHVVLVTWSFRPGPLWFIFIEVTLVLICWVLVGGVRGGGGVITFLIVRS